MMVRSSLVVTALTLLGSFLGLLVQLQIAKQFGSGTQVDGYLFAISTPTFLAGMLGSLLSYTVVPRMAQRHEQSMLQNQFLVSLLVGTTLLAAAFVLLSSFFMGVQKGFLPSASPIFQLRELDRLLALGWWIAALQILLACLSSALTGLKRPLIATSLNLGPYAGMLGLLFFTDYASVLTVAEGMLLGTATSFLLALLILSPRILPNWRSAKWSEIQTLVNRSPLTIVAMSCFSAYAVVDSYWAPRAGEGVLATLGYSQRIMIALGNLAVAGPSAILAPRFSELVAQRDYKQFINTLKTTFLTTAGIVLGLVFLLFVFSEKLITILFMRGAFDAYAVEQIATTLRYCLPGMVGMLLSVVALRVLFCFEYVEKIAAILGLLWVTGYFLLSGLLSKHGAYGLAIAYSVTWLMYFSGVVFVIRRRSNLFFNKTEN